MIVRYGRRHIYKTNYNFWARRSHRLRRKGTNIVSTLVFSSQRFYYFFLSRVCLFQWKLKRLKMYMTPFFVGFNVGLFFLTKATFLHLHRAKKKKNMTEKNKKKVTKRKSRLAWKRRNVKKKQISNHVFIHKSTFFISKNLRNSKIYNTPKVKVIANSKPGQRKKLSK